MTRSKSEINNVYSRLTVIEEGHIGTNRKKYWKCLCSCGNTTTVRGDHLRSGKITSCGCYNSEAASVRLTTHGCSAGNSVADEMQKRTYKIWANMVGRCTRSSHEHYKNYGGRGIKVCQDWLDFSNFLSAMGLCPEGYSIERIKVDGDYEPANCKWIPREHQAQNRRDTIWVKYKEELLCLAEACRRANIPYNYAKSQLKYDLVFEIIVEGYLEIQELI
jgi:hypothetical protein